jgi:hypothetical protein
MGEGLCQVRDNRRNQRDTRKYKFLVWFLDLKFQRVIRPSGPRLAAPKSALADLDNHESADLG